MGYGRSERGAYWSEIKFILGQIHRKDIIIWTTDNNGQIAKPTTSEDRGQGIRNDAHIGQWNYAAKTEKGNGGKLEKNYISTNFPRQTRSTRLRTMTDKDLQPG